MNTTPIEFPGATIILIDESVSMRETVSEGTKSMSEIVATAVNSLLNQLCNGPDFFISIVGYQTDPAGQPNIGCRWEGPLEGSEFVTISQLAESPVSIESRTRRIPDPTGMGVTREETIDFPIWYTPRHQEQSQDNVSAEIEAFQHCRQILSDLLAGDGATSATPLVLHVTGHFTENADLQEAVMALQHVETHAGCPLVFHAHLGSSGSVPPTKFPSNAAYLSPGASRELFYRSSELPHHMLLALREAGKQVNQGARGMVYRANMADLISFFSLIKSHANYGALAIPSSVGQEPSAPTIDTHAPSTESAPLESATPSPSAASSPAPAVTALEQAETPEAGAADGQAHQALVVLLIDRSVEDPSDEGSSNVYLRLQQCANDLLDQIAKNAIGIVDMAIVSYGDNPPGQTEIRTTFEGPLSGQTFVRDADLADGAIRVEEFEEQMSNGIGGLITVNRKRLIYVDLEPTASAPPLDGFGAVTPLVNQWCAEHPQHSAPPIVLHLTRGCFEPDHITQAAGQLGQIQSQAGPTMLHHLVQTEKLHRSVAYPSDCNQISDERVRTLWELSNPLIGAGQLAQTKPKISDQSRGIVVNGKFDVLLEGLKAALAS